MSVTLATLGGSLPVPKLLYPLGLRVLMAVLAVANGIFRELVLTPRTGEYGGHVLSTAMLVVAILLVFFAYFTSTAVAYTRLELLAVGAAWTVLTVGQYNVLAGQVWILVLLTLLTAPLLFGDVLSG
jgi:hypothetical protein